MPSGTEVIENTHVLNSNWHAICPGYDVLNATNTWHFEIHSWVKMTLLDALSISFLFCQDDKYQAQGSGVLYNRVA